MKGAEQEVAELKKDLAGSGAPLEGTVLRGFPAAELLRISETHPDVELVVVGRSGKGAIARALMGGVYHLVARFPNAVGNGRAPAAT